MLWLLVPVGLVTFYSMVGFFGVPYYISHFLPQQVSRDYDLQLAFEKVTFNPFTFIIALHASEVREPDGKPVLTLPHLELYLAPIQVLRLDFVCTKVDITAPSLYLVRHDDSSYNFGRLLPQLSQSHDRSKIMGFSNLPFFFSLNNISISDGTVVFDDKPTSKIHNIQQLELQLPTLANMVFQADNYISPHFSASINGSPVTLKGSNRGDTTPDSSPVTQLSWELKNVALQQYVDYLPFDLPFSLNNGTAAGVLDLKFSNRQDQDDKLAVHFDLSVTDIDIETQEKKLQLTSPAMHLSGSFIPVQKIFSVTAMQLNSPEIIVNSQNLMQEISSMFFSDPKKVDEAIPLKKPVIFALYSLQVTKGKLQQQTAAKDTVGEEWTGLSLILNNYVSHESYNLADNKPSILKMNGHKKDGSASETNVFSYFGSFKSPSRVSGELTIQKMEAKNLFSLILPEEKSLKAKGTGEMRALLTISKGSGETQFKSSLADITAKVTDLVLSTHSKPVFLAEELSLKGVQHGTTTTALGDITAKNAQLFYTGDTTPSFFSQLGSNHYTISTLNYQGDISISSRGKSGTPFRVTDATITYGTGDVLTKETENMVFSGDIGKNGKISATGKVSFKPFTIDVSTTFEQLDNAEATALFSSPTFLTITTGQLSGKGRFTFPKTSYAGDLKLTNGHFTRGAGQEFSWDTFALENINYNSNPYHAGAARIHFIKPQLAMSIQPKNNTIPEYCIELAREMLTNTVVQPSRQEKSVIFPDIQEISFTDGHLNITDQRLSPLWSGRIETVNGTITDIASAGGSSFSFTGKLDGSDLHWSGTTDFNDDTTTTAYRFELTDYPLKNFSSQLQPVSDVQFEAASISLGLSSAWRSGEQYQALQATMSELRTASPNAESALTIALLSDDNGVLEMNFSSVDSPTLLATSLFDNLTRNFQKRTIKANLSPLLLTKGDFSDLIDNEFIDFTPGQFLLSDKGRTNLTRYEALLVAHPHIKLSLSGGVSSEADRKSLYNQLKKDERLRIKKVNEILFSKWQKNKEEYEAQIRDSQNTTLSKGEISENNIPTKVLADFRPLLPEPVVVDNEMLFELAEKRLDIVRQHFITQLSPAQGRVEIKQQSINELLQNSSARGVHIRILPHN